MRFPLSFICPCFNDVKKDADIVSQLNVDILLQTHGVIQSNLVKISCFHCGLLKRESCWKNYANAKCVD